MSGPARVVWSNREAITRLARRCACGHTDISHGMWTDSACVFKCYCPGFTQHARVRLGSRWEA